jgi:hypothetical protein
MEDMDDEISEVPQVHSSRNSFFRIFVSYARKKMRENSIN